MPVHIAQNPLDCVVDGTGICLESDALGTLSGEKKKKR
jgi:actin-like ATPase involved in cell morphogenesis